MKKELGKIVKVEFGFGGYQECMFGLSLTFEGSFGGVCDFISGYWYESITISEYTKWTEEDRSRARIEMIKRVDKILSDAKVSSISELKNKPVEVIFENSQLKEWRILTEVL